MTHTPTPWKVAYEEGFESYYLDGPTLDSRGFVIITCQTDRAAEDAAHIVRCVNAHEALLEAVKEEYQALSHYQPTAIRVSYLKNLIARAEKSL